MKATVAGAPGACAAREQVAELRGLTVAQVLGLDDERKARRRRPPRRPPRPSRRRPPDGQLAITQVRSANGSSRKQRDTLRTLGLGKIGRTVEREDHPSVRGLIRSVGHLVEVRGWLTSERSWACTT